jgi:hypothetical protein
MLIESSSAVTTAEDGEAACAVPVVIVIVAITAISNSVTILV